MKINWCISILKMSCCIHWPIHTHFIRQSYKSIIYKKQKNAYLHPNTNIRTHTNTCVVMKKKNINEMKPFMQLFIHSFSDLVDTGGKYSKNNINIKKN